MDSSDLRFLLQRALERATSSSEVAAIRTEFLGKKGKIAALLQVLHDLPKEQKAALGAEVNQLKADATRWIDERWAEFQQAEETRQLAVDQLDVSLPGRYQWEGRPHVILQLMEEMLSILKGMGFTVQQGPNLETEYYNFSSLNFPENHPARDMQDTFYITDHLLLRTHTSNAEVRTMERSSPPIRVASPGKCFRNEDISKRSHVVFHQIEGLYIDEHVSFADLLDTLEEFFQKLFGSDVSIRLRPSYFPFVEPGAEVDVRCIGCQGKGCSICKRSGWLEVAGAGMTHPAVLRAGGINPEQYTGYAWGIGVERIAMLRYGIPDIRLFMENRLDFLRQF